MKKLAPALALLVLSAPSFSQTVEERLQALELANDLNWIKWSGSLESRYDYVNFQRNKNADDSVPTPGVSAGDIREGRDNNQYFRLWANLNMEAKPNDRLSFFGRLSMAKYMNVFGSTGAASTVASGAGEGQVATPSSTLFLERAFVNYNITDSFIFTMGRLPTIDGPNKHIALNQQLMGNYPALAYSAILDGFALTKGIDLGNSKLLRAKAIYTPSQQVNLANPNAPVTDSEGRKIESREDGFYSGLVEYEQNKGSFFEKNLTIFQYVRSDGHLILEDAAANGASDLNLTVNRFTLYTDFQRIGGTGFDIALQGMYSDVRSKGDFVSRDNALGNVSGWMTDKDDDKLYGHATVVTARYQLPINALNRPKIGAEWFNSSKEAFLYDLANVNPINMYQSPGSNVYHLFWNQDFGDGLSGNFGYFLRKQKRTYEQGGLLGKPMDVDNNDQNIYVSLLATF